MIEINKYKLLLLMYCLENSYEFTHEDLHLVDVDNLDKGSVFIYSVVHTDNKRRSLTIEETSDEVVNDLCSLYGLVKMDMDLYTKLKDMFDNGLLK